MRKPKCRDFSTKDIYISRYIDEDDNKNLDKEEVEDFTTFEDERNFIYCSDLYSYRDYLNFRKNYNYYLFLNSDDYSDKYRDCSYYDNCFDNEFYDIDFYGIDFDNFHIDNINLNDND